MSAPASMHSPEALWAHYDRLAEVNPVHAARFAESVRLFSSPRPPAQSPAVDTTGEREAPQPPHPDSPQARIAALTGVPSHEAATAALRTNGAADMTALHEHFARTRFP